MIDRTAEATTAGHEFWSVEDFPTNSLLPLAGWLTDIWIKKVKSLRDRWPGVVIKVLWQVSKFCGETKLSCIH